MLESGYINHKQFKQICYFQCESLTSNFKNRLSVSLWVGWWEFTLQTASVNNGVGWFEVMKFTQNVLAFYGLAA